MPDADAPTAPRFEHRTDDGAILGVGTRTPRLSWTVASADYGWVQDAYELTISRDGGTATYRVTSNEQILVPWPGEPLRARERAEVTVRVACGSDWTAWGPPAVVEAGLFDVEDWTARFISPAGEVAAIGGRAPILAGFLHVAGHIVKARLYASAHGIYRATLNGNPVDDTVLAPGWTSYQHRLRYHVYDVTELVSPGENTLEFLLGNGWYRGRLGYMNDRALYGQRLSLLAQLEVTTADGVVRRLGSDASWTARESEIVHDDLYDGQTTDLRLLAEPAAPSAVEVVPEDLSRLVAPDGPPIRPTALLPAQRIWTSPAGATLVDFGQNAVGWVRLRVQGMGAGHQVVLRHAEVLEHGELGTRPLRTAEATDRWVLAGPHREVLEPSLTLHGFRYAEVTGIAELALEDIELVVIGSDLHRTGWFSSSHDLLNRFHDNVYWSTRGNFIDLPTDCPQRDERLGWTGDIQIFGPTAMFLYDSAGLLSSWLADLAAEQLPDGAVPHVVPDVNRNGLSRTPAAAWGDAATIVPWTLYERTGDLEVLARQLPSMRAWVDRVTTLTGPDRLWTGGFQYGDWLDPSAPPDDPYRARADNDLVATAHFARSAWIVGQTARLLGRTDDARRYDSLAAEVRGAFVEAFVTPSGRIVSDAQTAYALAIAWDLLPTALQRDTAGSRLADLVRGSGFRIATGFVGTPLICDALTMTGHADVAYRLLLQTECPSWLYPVSMDATTIWERWDSMLPDGSINPGEMTSFNHYALGAVADWMHRTVAGLAPAQPGYRSLLVRPVMCRQLLRAEARHLTPYGEAAVGWERKGGRLYLKVSVPVGATAEVHIPGKSTPVTMRHGSCVWELADPIAVEVGVVPDWAHATVRDLLDDPFMWTNVVHAVQRSGLLTDDADIARSVAAYLDLPAVRVVEALAPEERLPGAQELRREVLALLGATPLDAAFV